MRPLKSLFIDTSCSSTELEPDIIKANSHDDCIGGSWQFERIFFEKAFEMIDVATFEFDPKKYILLDDYKKEILRNENSKYLNWIKIRGLKIEKFRTKYQTYIEALDKMYDLVHKYIVSKMLSGEIDKILIQNMKNLRELTRNVIETREGRLRPKTMGYLSHLDILARWVKIESLFYPEHFFQYPYIAHVDPLNIIGTKFRNCKAMIAWFKPWKVVFRKLDKMRTYFNF